MNKQPVDIHGKQYNRNLLVLVLIIGSFCTVLNGTLLSTALPSIMRDFKISTATAEWLSTAFLLVNGVMIPISAWLINRFGSRKMYLSAMSTFFIGTVIAAIAPNFQTLLAGRIIQGLGVGVTMPLLQTIMLSIFPVWLGSRQSFLALPFQHYCSNCRNCCNPCRLFSKRRFAN